MLLYFSPEEEKANHLEHNQCRSNRGNSFITSSDFVALNQTCYFILLLSWDYCNREGEEQATDAGDRFLPHDFHDGRNLDAPGLQRQRFLRHRIFLLVHSVFGYAEGLYRLGREEHVDQRHIHCADGRIVKRIAEGT